ncbi:hypothetical protein L3V83_12770 [Thiotrichales bacterium 19X7-9]|nr:hypothetical protein [Thiotrichales bacterium 19X7-9]
MPNENITYSYNRSNSTLNIHANANFTLNDHSFNYLQSAYFEVKPNHYISFSGIVNKNTGEIDFLPNIPRKKAANSDTLRTLEHQPLEDFSPIVFPNNPQILLEEDLAEIYRDRFDFPCYQPGVNRIPEHVKHVYQRLHPNDFNTKIGLEQAKQFLGFTVNICKNEDGSIEILTDGKSQSLNGLALSLSQHWALQPPEGSELNADITTRVQTTIKNALIQFLQNEVSSNVQSNKPNYLFLDKQSSKNLDQSTDHTNTGPKS